MRSAAGTSSTYRRLHDPSKDQTANNSDIRHRERITRDKPLFFRPAGDYGANERLKPGVIARSGVHRHVQVRRADSRPKGDLRVRANWVFSDAEHWIKGCHEGYWIIIGTAVSDQYAQAEYGRLWKPIAEKYQAKINPLKTLPLLKEARDAHRIVVVEFPSYQIALDCYEDPAYTAAKSFASKAANRELLIVAGELS